MPPSRILDSHIHLWPATACAATNHGWMTPSHQLAKRHGIEDYVKVTGPRPEGGFVYVETDRYLASLEPELKDGQGEEEEWRRKIAEWAKEPLEEVKFLRRIVEGKGEEGDGFADADVDGDEDGDGGLMKACVVWAPFHLGPALFSTYLSIAEEVAGPRLWRRVVGLRYLLQGKAAGEVKALDGVEPLEAVGEMMERVRMWEAKSQLPGNPVKFIINHLAKPPLSPTNPQPDERWRQALTALSTDKDVYMKLSGAFNEFGTPTPSDVPALLTSLAPFLKHISICFPKRVMFGSDWPVCNVGGPRGEEGNWGLWVEVVEAWMNLQAFSEEEREDVWWRAGCSGYGVKF
ncbi:hypothetical protein EJ02DRAFT_433090 [Clathrospora elynae]|uniref:Amidohydrolase-related domain-containing protein n=1 Tax=Clathrospora elynae TaxID=706981 RepID=A0A6A5SUV1_9PLEO|nr:hypothetical protein EJ02DRAFT_433090 [Clathrospora elynae]